MVKSLRSRALDYAIAVAAIGACIVVQTVTWPLLEPTPYQIFYLAVGVIAWRIGTGPALLAIALGLIAVDYLFLSTLHRIDLGVEAVGPVIFTTIAAALIGRLGARSRRIRGELSEAHAELERRVRERTVELEGKNAELLRENAERERAEQALRQSETRARLITESVLDIITILGPDGTIRYESPSVERVLGYSTEELVGTNAFERVHPDDIAGVLEVFAAAIEQPGATRNVQLRFRHSDGSWRVLEVVGRNLLDDEIVAGVLLSSRDVTDRWEAERSLQQQQEFLHAVLENAQDAIVAFDAEGRLTLLNRAAREVYPSARLAVPVETWIGGHEFLDGDGVRPLEQGEIPLVRAVRGEQFRDVAMSVRGDDGASRSLLASGRPINDRTGARLGAVVVAHDVTEMRRAQRERVRRELEQAARRAIEEQQQRLEFLVRAGAVLGESLDFERTLGSVARLSIGVLADWCIVDILGEEGAINRIAVGHADPEKDRLAQELCRFPPDPAKPVGVPLVLRTGRPELVAEVSEEYTRRATQSDEHYEIIRRLGASSAMFVPLVAHDRVVGAISFFSSGGRRYDQDDLALASELSRRGAHAIESAQLFQAERSSRALAERAAERTAQLQSITAAFGEALTAAQVADVLIDQGLPIVGAVAGSLAVIAESGHEIEIVRSTGYTPEMLRTWGRFSIDARVPLAESVSSGAPIFIDSREELAERYPHLVESNEGTDVTGWAALPLWAEDRIIGAIGVSFERPNAHEQENRHLLMALARQCGQALDRARLYDAERHARAEAEQARRSLAAIAEASAVLASQLDFQATLRSIARLAVPMLADTCVVDVLESEGTMRRVAVAGSTHHAEQLLLEMMRRYPTGSRESLRYQVLESGRPILVARTDEAWISRVAVDDEHADLLRSLGQRSYVYLPLRARGRTFGAMGLATLDGRRRYAESDIPPAQEIALRAAVALDNARLYEEANEANRAKDEFLATVSHEVRTPLNAILGWSQMLRDGGLDEETAAHAVEAIERNARVQAQIIEDILDISRVIAGKLRLEPRRIDVAPVVAAALDAVRPAAETASVTLTSDVEPGLPSLLADPGRLQQVLWNLLLNAVKFTPAGGSVALSVRMAGGEIVFSVADTGAGIDPEFLPFVFERFRQADAGSGRRHGGLGLGLAIVRAIVQMHGGSVSAVSPGIGLGSTFTVRIPAREASTAPGAIVEVDGPSAPPIGGDGALKGLRIVIVDDEPDARDLLRMTLTRSGAEVRSAERAADALSMIRQWHPDLLVSDIAMPVEDGYTLVTRLRTLSDEEGGATPAVALTAFARLEDRDRAMAAGFQEHLPKPVDPQRLVRVLASLAGRVE